MRSTLEILAVVPAREGPKAKLPPLGGRGRWASGVLADGDRSRNAKPAPYNAKSADPRMPAREYFVLGLRSSGDALLQT
jgi:hypothetical protein